MWSPLRALLCLSCALLAAPSALEFREEELEGFARVPRSISRLAGALARRRRGGKALMPAAASTASSHPSSSSSSSRSLPPPGINSNQRALGLPLAPITNTTSPWGGLPIDGVSRAPPHMLEEAMAALVFSLLALIVGLALPKRTSKVAREEGDGTPAAPLIPKPRAVDANICTAAMAMFRRRMGGASATDLSSLYPHQNGAPEGLDALTILASHMRAENGNGQTHAADAPPSEEVKSGDDIDHSSSTTTKIKRDSTPEAHSLAKHTSSPGSPTKHTTHPRGLRFHLTHKESCGMNDLADETGGPSLVPPLVT